MSTDFFFEPGSLFKECVDDLRAKILTLEQSKNMAAEFKTMFPITSWGKIDWEKINKKRHIGHEPANIISSLKKLLKTNDFDTGVYVYWSTGGLHIIESNLETIVNNFASVNCVAFEKFIFNPTLGYIVEIRPGGDTTVGVVD